jgi:hypothetical protein
MGTGEMLYDLFSGKVVVRHSDSLFSLGPAVIDCATRLGCIDAEA